MGRSYCRNTANRLDDTEGNDEFCNHFNDLILTGLGKENLAAVLNAEQPEERAWAAGEALAEHFLKRIKVLYFHGIWNVINETPLEACPVQI